MGEHLMELREEPFEIERTWEVEGVPVLRASIRLPKPSEGQRNRVCRRIRRYYNTQGRAYLRRCETWLLPAAQTAYRTALETSAPLPCFQAELDYHITRNQDGLWSLYTQAREHIGTGPVQLLRWGDTWDLSTGYPIPLSRFFPKGTPWKKQILSVAAASIEKQESAGVARYRDSWRKDLRRRFNARNFYLTKEGLSIFYRMYTIGPAAEGIPVFSLPYAQDGPCSRPF